jgi:hypothetical protein
MLEDVVHTAAEVKFTPEQVINAPSGSRDITTLSLTSAPDGGGWSTPRPGRFTLWKETRYPLYKRMGWSQCRSGRGRKISTPPGFDPPTAQPVASRCTGYATLPYTFATAIWRVSGIIIIAANLLPSSDTRIELFLLSFWFPYFLLFT